jgi:hypothetical protein
VVKALFSEKRTAMQVRIEDVSPVEKKLLVEVPWATISSAMLTVSSAAAFS